jgi:hypothetical protein
VRRTPWPASSRPGPTGSERRERRQRNYLLAAVGAVALALLVLALANRWITKPLSRLADEARVMASERLPNAVNAILETPLGEDVVPPVIEPIHVRGGAEVLGAVEALNAVQVSAIGLAVEQVVLRRNIADSFGEPRPPTRTCSPPTRPHPHLERKVGRRGLRAAVPARPPRHPCAAPSRCSAAR